MELLLEKYKSLKNRDSTVKNYQFVWRKFNSFLLQLDQKPKFWEDRAMLFCAHLIDNGIKSATLKSYISAIKSILVDDNYNWDDGKMLLWTLSRPYRQTNDKLTVRLSIHLNLLEIILFEIQCFYHQQEYLMIMYHTIFCISYYGLFRVGEVTMGTHPIRACDVHV